jgi:PAS domain S-box-containing protein
MTADIDFTAFFDAAPSPYLVLDADLVIRYANPACLRTAGRTEEQLTGKYFFDALPEKPGSRDDAEGDLKSSLHRLLATGQPETAVLRRYDVSAAGQRDGFEERWWSVIHTPLCGPDGTVRWIIQQLTDVTAFVRSSSARQVGEEPPEAPRTWRPSCSRAPASCTG